MCTVTWWLAPDLGGYELFFNRDERRSRGQASFPGFADCRNEAYLAPTDADHKGTWLLVNGHGVSLGLVNHYPPQSARGESPALSRGQLLRDLADVSSAAAVAERLAAAPLRRYAGFYLLALGLREPPRRWRWDTHTLLDETGVDPWPFLTSSSFRGAEIAAHRRELFGRMLAGKTTADPAQLEQFHRQREAEQPAWGILMDRPDARTVSLSHLIVGPNDAAVFTYATRSSRDGAPPGPPFVSRLPVRRQR